MNHLLALDWNVVGPNMQTLLAGLGYTVEISLVGIVLGLILGWTFGLLSVSHVRIFRWVTRTYVELIRGTPLLVQILLVYFGLSGLGINLSPFLAGTIALGVNSGGFQAEIVRAGLQSIDPGQSEAAKAIGLRHRDTLVHILVPQVVRRVIPPLTNELISLIKGSSLLSVIAFSELTHEGELIIARTFTPFEIYIVVAALYFCVVAVLSRISALLERVLPQV